MDRNVAFSFKFIHLSIHSFIHSANVPSAQNTHWWTLRAQSCLTEPGGGGTESKWSHKYERITNQAQERQDFRMVGGVVRGLPKAGPFLMGTDPPGSLSPTDTGSVGRWLACTVAGCPPMGSAPSMM